MKNFAIALLLLISVSVSAQTFVYSTDQHAYKATTTATYMGIDIKFTTPQPENITFKWKRIKNTLPGDWSFSLCDYGGCYVGVPQSGTMQPYTIEAMNDGEEVKFTLNVSPKSFGKGRVELYVYDANDINRGDTVSFYLVYNEVLSLEPAIEDEIQIFPNPATNLLKVSANTHSTQLTITNTLGTVVMETELQRSVENAIDISGLETGLYIVALRSDTGILYTEKLIIQ